jgi:hypothetical protein
MPTPMHRNFPCFSLRYDQFLVGCRMARPVKPVNAVKNSSGRV